MPKAVALERVERRIVLLRGHKVMLSTDLAELYGVEPKVLIQAVKRNVERFPGDFMFQLTAEESRALRSQFVTLEIGRGKYAKYWPYAFTEQGVAMLSSVLKSRRAVLVNIAIMRAFVRLRELLTTHKDLARRLDALEQKYDAQFKGVFDAIRELMKPSEPLRHRIGFHADHDLPVERLTRVKDMLPTPARLAHGSKMAKNKKTMVKGFDKHLHELLEAHPEAALEHAKLFAELPLPTQLAIRKKLDLLRRLRQGSRDARLKRGRFVG